MLLRTGLRSLGVIVAAVLGISLLAVPTVGSATTVRQDKVVSDNPVNWTPHALDKSVKAIVQVGDTVVSGGDFTRVADRDVTSEISQPNVFAFNATTGDLSTGFRPAITGGAVEALAAHPDGDKVWVAGDFTTVNGVKWPKSALLRLSDGSLVTSFTKTSFDGKVRDLAVAGDRLIVGGTFKTIKGVSQGHLAALRISNGAYDPFISLPFAGQNNGGVTAVAKFDVSADGTRLVAIGNFTSVNGQARGQVAVLDLTGSSARLADWATARYPNVCPRRSTPTCAMWTSIPMARISSS